MKEQSRWRGDMYDPNEHNWLYHQQLIRGDLRGFTDLADRVPAKSTYCNFTAGVLKRHHGKISDSLQEFRSLMKENDSAKLETVQAASRSLFLLGRYKAAADSLNQIDKAKDSSDWKHHLYLGQCYKAAGHPEKASKHFSMSLDKSPNVDAYVEMADSACSSADKSNALESIKKGLELFPESHKLSLKHGEITTDSLLITRRALPETDLNYAMQFLRLATESDSDASLMLGALLQRTSAEKAIVCYRDVYNENPASPQLWNNLGVLCIQKGKKLAAMACFRRATYVDPMFWKAWLNLAMFYLRNGQLVGAFNAFSHVLSLYRNAFIFNLFAVNLQLLGQMENAAKAFKKSKRMESELVDINERLTCLQNRFVFYANYEGISTGETKADFKKSLSKKLAQEKEAMYSESPRYLEPELEKRLNTFFAEFGMVI